MVLTEERGMATTVSDALLDRLIDWGVDTIFGLPGDGINGFMEALRKRRDEVRFVHTRHEETAALAACAYAKFTGRLGVCLSTAAPGAIHLLNGLYDAKVDQAASDPLARHLNELLRARRGEGCRRGAGGRRLRR
jgi:thiamine pyrophosphate-dependent acetolactate synthase large subunit-like protein